MARPCEFVSSESAICNWFPWRSPDECKTKLSGASSVWKGLNVVLSIVFRRNEAAASPNSASLISECQSSQCDTQCFDENRRNVHLLSGHMILICLCHGLARMEVHSRIEKKSRNVVHNKEMYIIHTGWFISYWLEKQKNSQKISSKELGPEFSISENRRSESKWMDVRRLVSAEMLLKIYEFLHIN